MSDLIVERYGNRYLMRPLNEQAAAWLKIAPEDAVFIDDALVLDRRDVEMAVAYLERHGLSIDYDVEIEE